MELLLNVFWFLLAVISVALWWACRSRASQNRVEPELLREAVSLGCVLVLLFFAISLTDDLHAVPAVAEESRSSRRSLQTLKGASAEPDPEKQAPHFAQTVPSTLFIALAVVLNQLAIIDAPPFQSAPARPTGGRAPPSPCSLARTLAATN